jgi:Protein of unknown function (DUF3352)
MSISRATWPRRSRSNSPATIPALVKPRAIALLPACAAALAAIVTGCGSGDSGGGNVDVGPAAAVPQNAALYLDGTVKPTGSAEADARAAAGKIMGTSDPGGKIVSLIEREAKADGHPIDYQQDVAPWLGEKAGAFFTSFADNAQKGAVVVQTTDVNASLAFARKASGATPTNPAPQTYKGVSYQADPSQAGSVFGVVGNFLVEGDVAGFRAAVDASQGESLGDSSGFEDAIGDLPDDRLGTIYTIPKSLLGALGPGQIDASSRQLLEKSAGDSLQQPVFGALTASATSIDLEATGGSNGVDTPQSSLIGDVPSQAWLALGAADLGDAVKRTLDQVKDSTPNFDQAVQQLEATTGSSLDQLTASLGNAALYVEGTTPSTLTGALMVQSRNTDLTGRLIDQLRGLLQVAGSSGVKPLHLSGGGSGFQIHDPSAAPAPVEIAQQGERIVIGYGAGSAERTLTPAQNLQSNPTFSAAQGQVSSLGTDFFLDLPSVFRLAESTGSKSDPDYVRAKPYLDALSYVVTGSGTKGDQAEFKAVVGLR